MKKLGDIKGKNILIDTNILIYYAEKGFIERSGNPLGLLRDNGNNLFVSEITGFELLRGENSDEKTQKFLEFLRYITNIPIDKIVLNNGALFARKYRKFCGGKKLNNPADLIISGTVIGQELLGQEILLFTHDRSDFCEPVWETVSCHLVQESAGEFVQHCFYLLKLNTELIKTS